jgi:hypothetical protein
MIRNLVPVSTASPERAVCKPLALAGKLCAHLVLTPRAALPYEQYYVRLCGADLRENPTELASVAHSSRRYRAPQYSIFDSTNLLFTDIWRTGSGQSKRLGEPLAVADGDGIRRLPARSPSTKARPPRHPYACQPGHHPSTLTMANRPWRVPPSPPGLPRLASRCSGHPEPAGNTTSKATPAPGAPAARDRPRPTLVVSRR